MKKQGRKLKPLGQIMSELFSLGSCSKDRMPVVLNGDGIAYNPLLNIRIGTADEVYQALALARKIYRPFNFRYGHEDPLSYEEHLMAMLFLHCIYAHFSDPVNYCRFPAIEDVISFVQLNFLEKVEEDDAGTQKRIIRPCVLIDMIADEILSFTYVPDNGIDIVYPRLDGFYEESVHFTREDMVNLYPAYAFVLKLMPGTHPWLYKSFCHCLYYSGNNDMWIFNKVDNVVLALEQYLLEHSELRNK